MCFPFTSCFASYMWWRPSYYTLLRSCWSKETTARRLSIVAKVGGANHIWLPVSVLLLEDDEGLGLLHHRHFSVDAANTFLICLNNFIGEFRRYPCLFRVRLTVTFWVTYGRVTSSIWAPISSLWGTLITSSVLLLILHCHPVFVEVFRNLSCWIIFVIILIIPIVILFL